MAHKRRGFEELKMLVEKYNIHFEYSGDASKWPERHQQLFRGVQDLRKLNYTDYSSETDSHVPTRAGRRQILHQASKIMIVARKCTQENANEATWRATIEREILQSFAWEVICKECNSKLEDSELVDGIHLDQDAHQHSEQLYKSESKNCLCLSMAHNSDFADDYTDPMFGEHIDMPFIVDSSLEEELPARFRIDCVVALQRTDISKNLQLKDEGAFSQIETMWQRIQTSPFESAATGAVFPFLIVESKAELSRNTFVDVELRTAFPIRTLLKLQHDLNSVSSHEVRISDEPLVWCLFSCGSDWRLAGACIEERKGVPQYHVMYLWMGNILRRDDALQLVLIVKYIVDWARNVYRPDICSKLGSLLKESDETTINLDHQVSDSLSEEETTYDITAVPGLANETSSRVLGPEHPDMLSSIDNLATMLRHQSQHDEAEAKTNKDDQNDNDDNLSEVSSALPSLVSDSTNISRQDKYNDAMEHLVEIFCAEENAGLTYREAIEKFPADRFRYKHDQLLKLYFKELRHEASSGIELATQRLLRTRSCRYKVTSLILKLLQPFENSGENTLTEYLLEGRKTERDHAINKMLQGIDVVPNPSIDQDENYSTLKREEDDASDSSGLSNDSEENLIQGGGSPLQAIDAFLTGGKAFAQFKINLDSLLHPPPSFEVALSSKSVFVVKQFLKDQDSLPDVAKKMVLDLRRQGQSDTEIAEHLLTKEKASEDDVDRTLDSIPLVDTEPTPTKGIQPLVLLLRNFYTLPLIRRLVHRKLRTGWTRLVWQCDCGEMVYGDFERVSAATISAIHATFGEVKVFAPSSAPGGDTWTTSTVGNTTKLPHNAVNPVESFSQAPRKQGIGSSNLDGAAAPSNLPDPVTQDMATRPRVVPSMRKKFLGLCIPNRAVPFILGEVDVSGRLGESDYMVFTALRTKYDVERHRSWISSWLNFFEPAGGSFVKFVLDLDLSAAVTARGSIPPAKIVGPDKEYDYLPVPMRDRPPIPSEQIRHYLTKVTPKHARRFWSQRLPHKLDQYACFETKHHAEAWGIEIQEGPNWLKISLVSLIAVLLSGLVAGIYGWTMQDAGTATTIGGWLTAVQTLFVAVAFFKWA